MPLPIFNYHIATIDSTNSWAMREKEHLQEQSLTLFSANGQTAGRGRFKRTWLSPQGKNLYMTLALYFSSPLWGFRLTQMMSLSVCIALQERHCLATLKWPNDVQVQGEKIAGILTESALARGVQFYAIGVGLNINAHKEDLLLNPGKTATSLLLKTGIEHSVEEVKWQVIRHFVHYLDKGANGKLNHIHEEWKTLMKEMVGQQYRIQTPHRGIFEGKIEGFGSDGSLLLRTFDHKIQVITSGDIF